MSACEATASAPRTTADPGRAPRSDRGTTSGSSTATRAAKSPRRARPEHVQADASDDRGQPPAQVLDPAGVSPAQPEPGFLHGVVRLAEGAEHPVGHGPQVGPVLLEAFGRPFDAVHRSHSFVAACHLY